MESVNSRLVYALKRRIAFILGKPHFTRAAEILARIERAILRRNTGAAGRPSQQVSGPSLCDEWGTVLPIFRAWRQDASGFGRRLGQHEVPDLPAVIGRFAGLEQRHTRAAPIGQRSRRCRWRKSSDRASRLGSWRGRFSYRSFSYGVTRMKKGIGQMGFFLPSRFLGVGPPFPGGAQRRGYIGGWLRHGSAGVGRGVERGVEAGVAHG